MTFTQDTAPNLNDFDWIVISSSGGKDSQAMLDLLSGLADQAGVSDRVVVVHADLGRVEWTGTLDLAREQAEHYGHRFEVVARDEDLLDHVRSRGFWPSAKERYCTSDHKRGQVWKLFTRLANETHGNARGKVDRPCRILDCQGLRIEESAGRGKRLRQIAAENGGHWTQSRATNGRREVVSFYPIATWTETDVWERIRTSGVRYHEAYDLGMARLSCAFCIFGTRDDLLIAGEHNRQLLDAYVEVEREIDHKFTLRLPIVEIRDALDRGERGRPHAGSPCSTCSGCSAAA
ncbi:MAG: phosphoadenosine phosphosulfate reductase family protein [Myxococcota bacterium]